MKTTVDELSASMGQVIPIAQAQGVGFDQLAASYAVLTKNGVATSEAGTGMKAMFGELGKAGSKTDKILREKTGKSFSELSAEGKTTSDVLAILQKEADDSGLKLSDMFGSVQAGGAALVLATEDGKEFDEFLGEMNESAGATERAFETMAETTENKMAIAWTSIKNSLASMGDMLLPIVSDIAGGIAGLVAKFDGLSDSTKKNIMVIGGIAAVVGPVLVVFGYLIGALGTIFTAMGTVSAAVAVVTTGVASTVPAVSALAGVFTVLTGPIGIAVLAIAAIGVGVVAMVKHFKKDAIPEVDRFGKGVSDSTKEALGGFFDLSDGASQSMAEISITGSKVTEEMKTDIVGKFSEMNAQIIEGMETRHEEQEKSMRTFFENSSVLTKEEEAEIAKNQGMRNQKELADQHQQEVEIKNIMETASKEKRELTEQEKETINSINEQMQETAVMVLSESEMEQKIILERMATSAGDISAKQAAEVVKNSAKARDGSIKEAEKTYDGTIAEIVRMRDETGDITEEQADKLIKEAKKQRDGSTKEAKTMHEDVVSEAQKQAEGHVDHVNWETGEVLSKWEVFKNGVGKKFGDISKNAKKKWKEVSTSVKESWSESWSDTKDKAEKIRERAASKFGDMKKSIGDSMADAKKNVADGFTDMVDGAKKLPGRIGTGIKNAAGKASSAMKSMGNKMLSALEKPINGMLDGVNWVTGKLGIKKTIDDVKLPRYAKGTDGHPGGDFIAGEEGRELVKLPNGESFVTPNKATFYPNMPKGTHVIPNKATEDILKFDIPHFAKGTKGWLGKIGDVWDYVKNPSKIMNKLLDGLGIGKVKGFTKDLAGAGWEFLKTKPVEYIKGMFGKAEEDGLAPGSGKPAFNWPVTSGFGYRRHPIFGTQRLHAGTDYGAPSGSPIPSTTGGKVSFAGMAGGFGNLVKVKNGMMEMFYAHMSKIMVSRGQSVKKGDTLGLVGSTGNSTGPHLHYETHKNGKAINPMSIKGFANGGLIKKQQLAMVGEGGYEEVIIPTGDPRKRTNAQKLLALAARKLGGGSGGSVSPSSLPNVNSGDSEELSLLRKQVELLTELVLSSRNIEAKPVLSEGDINRSYNKVDAQQSSKHGVFAGRPRG